MVPVHMRYDSVKGKKNILSFTDGIVDIIQFNLEVKHGGIITQPNYLRFLGSVIASNNFITSPPNFTIKHHQFIIIL
ncbi:hypothetical protein QVD17_39165 [Tagetes erecta]|uniref:Uncharacterized protein n=1 Tax=Tagetes erecta TaxID=13708 RepID=A0AAD8JRT4_TARER|nr:hypothetical protein QVD17_39165 [Tagetes erecta]